MRRGRAYCRCKHLWDNPLSYILLVTLTRSRVTALSPPYYRLYGKADNNQADGEEIRQATIGKVIAYESAYEGAGDKANRQKSFVQSSDMSAFSAASEAIAQMARVYISRPGTEQG